MDPFLDHLERDDDVITNGSTDHAYSLRFYFARSHETTVALSRLAADPLHAY